MAGFVYHFPGGIRTCNPWKRAAADPRAATGIGCPDNKYPNLIISIYELILDSYECIAVVYVKMHVMI